MCALQIHKSTYPHFPRSSPHLIPNFQLPKSNWVCLAGKIGDKYSSPGNATIASSELCHCFPSNTTIALIQFILIILLYCQYCLLRVMSLQNSCLFYLLTLLPFFLLLPSYQGTGISFEFLSGHCHLFFRVSFKALAPLFRVSFKALAALSIYVIALSLLNSPPLCLLSYI